MATYQPKISRLEQLTQLLFMITIILTLMLKIPWQIGIFQISLSILMYFEAAIYDVWLTKLKEAARTGKI